MLGYVTGAFALAGIGLAAFRQFFAATVCFAFALLCGAMTLLTYAL